MTISTEQIVALAAVIGAIGVIYTFVSKPFKSIRDLTDSVNKLTEKVDDINEDMKMQGDMIYQLLDHASTNNNTGGMRDALDRYNAYYRH